jgi:hypothetical protein
VWPTRCQWLCSLGMLSLLLAGCASSPCPKTPLGSELEAVERGTIEPTFPDVPASPSTSFLGREEPFRGLTAEDCQCRAVRSSTMGNLLASQQEQSRLPCLPCHKGKSLYREVLDYSADEARNRSAGDALEAYYQLAEAEGKDDLLRSSASPSSGNAANSWPTASRPAWRLTSSTPS